MAVDGRRCLPAAAGVPRRGRPLRRRVRRRGHRLAAGLPGRPGRPGLDPNPQSECTIHARRRPGIGVAGPGHRARCHAGAQPRRDRRSVRRRCHDAGRGGRRGHRQGRGTGQPGRRFRRRGPGDERRRSTARGFGRYRVDGTVRGQLVGIGRGVRGPDRHRGPGRRPAVPRPLRPRHCHELPRTHQCARSATRTTAVRCAEGTVRRRGGAVHRIRHRRSGRRGHRIR